MEPKLSMIDLANYLGISLQALHKKLKTNNISPLKSSNKTYLRFQESRKLINFPFKSQIISFQIVKGGTGKTTIAHSIAIRANLYGAQVLCVDLDQQGNLTQALRVNADNLPVMVDLIQDKIPFSDAIVQVYDGLDLIPSRIENAVLDNLLVLNRLPLDQVFSNPFSSFKKNYDLIIIDCPLPSAKLWQQQHWLLIWLCPLLSLKDFRFLGLMLLLKKYMSFLLITEKISTSS